MPTPSSSLIEGDVYATLDIVKVVGVRNSFGGTSFEQVQVQLKKALEWLNTMK